MSKTFAVVFGGALAFILLALYAFTVVYMIVAALGWGRTVPVPTNALEFSDGLVFVVTTIGGLVSALVVAKLAATTPGDSPSIRNITSTTTAAQKKNDSWLAGVYLAVWLLVGLGALVVGVMMYPEANQTLHDIGTTWLGLGVASGYAYFGIQPKT
jgi:hypothetical protein